MLECCGNVLLWKLRWVENFHWHLVAPRLRYTKTDCFLNERSIDVADASGWNDVPKLRYCAANHIRIQWESEMCWRRSGEKMKICNPFQTCDGPSACVSCGYIPHQLFSWSCSSLFSNLAMKTVHLNICKLRSHWAHLFWPIWNCAWGFCQLIKGFFGGSCTSHDFFRSNGKLPETYAAVGAERRIDKKPHAHAATCTEI